MRIALLLPAGLAPRACGLLLAACGLLLAGCHNREAAAQGAALYAQNCASCHGPGGRGQNPARPSGALVPEREGFIAPALDGRGHCAEHPREELVRIVREGSRVPGSPMIGVQGRLTDPEIRAIVSYLESLWDRRTRNRYEARERALGAKN
jgi:mono/diheme cytochrome c family protein